MHQEIGGRRRRPPIHGGSGTSRQIAGAQPKVEHLVPGGQQKGKPEEKLQHVEFGGQHCVMCELVPVPLQQRPGQQVKKIELDTQHSWVAVQHSALSPWPQVVMSLAQTQRPF